MKNNGDGTYDDDIPVLLWINTQERECLIIMLVYKENPVQYIQKQMNEKKKNSLHKCLPALQVDKDMSLFWSRDIDKLVYVNAWLTYT